MRFLLFLIPFLFVPLVFADSYLTTGDATAKSSQYIIVGEGSNTTISGNSANSSAQTGGEKSSATAQTTVSTDGQVQSTLEVEVNGEKETKTVTITGTIKLEKTSDTEPSRVATSADIKGSSIISRAVRFVTGILRSLVEHFFQF